MIGGLGELGIIFITGIVYSINLAGVTAGVAAVFLGQMVLSITADTIGWGSVEPIPLDSRRAIGLIIMGISGILLLPRKYLKKKREWFLHSLFRSKIASNDRF